MATGEEVDDETLGGATMHATVSLLSISYPSSLFLSSSPLLFSHAQLNLTHTLTLSHFLFIFNIRDSKKVSGVSDFLANNELHAIQMAREIVDTLNYKKKYYYFN